MDYEDLIDDEAGPSREEDAPELEADPVEPRKSSPWKAFILTGLLASLIGAVGGGYGVFEGLKRQSPSVTEAPKIDLTPVEAKLKDLSQRVRAAEDSLESVANRPTVISEPVDLSSLEARLAALEIAPSPEIDPEALTALQAAQEDGFDWPDTSALETKLSDLEAKLAQDVDAPSIPAELTQRLDDLETKLNAPMTKAALSKPDLKRLSALEKRLAELENRPTPTAKIQRVSVLAFPKDAMVKVAENSVEGGFMKKALSKHVRVKDEDAPLTLIEGIEADIAKGRLEDAAKKYDRLPVPVQDAGKAWYESVKASL